MKLLNIGCGSVFHTFWTNIDLVSASPAVQVHDLRKKFPYSDAYFNACYNSHVLEHFTIQEASSLLAECWRILKPQGIVRIVVPNLEEIVKNYLKILNKIEAEHIEIELNYDWIMLELYDQTVRYFSGGEMGRYLNKHNINNKEFIISRIGQEAENYWLKQENNIKKSIWKKIKSKTPSWFIQKFRTHFAKTLVTLVAGKKARQAFEEGLFRQSGEIHRWMYDRFSLRRILEQSGFIDVQVCRADESRIPDFNSYDLDMVDGKVRKPDSLFMEAIKP